MIEEYTTALSVCVDAQILTSVPASTDVSSSVEIPRAATSVNVLQDINCRPTRKPAQVSRSSFYVVSASVKHRLHSYFHLLCTYVVQHAVLQAVATTNPQQTVSLQLV